MSSFSPEFIQWTKSGTSEELLGYDPIESVRDSNQRLFGRTENSTLFDDINIYAQDNHGRYAINSGKSWANSAESDYRGGGRLDTVNIYREDTAPFIQGIEDAWRSGGMPDSGPIGSKAVGKLSEEDYLKIAAINPSVLDKDSDGGSTITKSEVSSTLGIEESDSRKNTFKIEYGGINSPNPPAGFEGIRFSGIPIVDGKVVTKNDSFKKWVNENEEKIGPKLQELTNAELGIKENPNWTLGSSGNSYRDMFDSGSSGTGGKLHYMSRGKYHTYLKARLRYATQAWQYASSEPGNSEEIREALDSRELTKSEKRFLMLRNYGSMGFNGFNKVLASTRTAIQELYGKPIDEQSVASFIANDAGNVNLLLGEWRKKRRGEEYSLAGIKTELLTDNGDSYSVDSSKVSAAAKAMTPYDFENGGKFFGNTEFKKNSGVRVETGNYYSEKSAPGWSEHSILGSVYKGDESSTFSYSQEFGWVSLDEKNGSDWFFLDKTKTWMYPAANDNGIFFYSMGTGEVPSEGEWLYPNNTGQLYDFKTEQFYDPEELGAREFEKNADPIDSIGDDSSNPNSDQNQTTENENTTENPDNDMGGDNMSESSELPPNYFEDEWGVYYKEPSINREENNWLYRATGDVRGWWYEDPDSRWIWGENTGWMWAQKSTTGNYFKHEGSDEWVYAREGNWLTSEGEAFDFDAYPKTPIEQPPRSEPGQPPGTEPGGEIPTPISYANQIIENPMEGLTALKKQLDDTARSLAYEGFDGGMIAGMLKGTDLYKDIMDFFSNDPEQKQYADLVDGIVQQVAEVNSQKHNVATYLDFADSRGMGMLDPRLSQQEKVKIRTAKPSRPASQADVDQGLADEVGQIIRNPDYDPELSMYFEYRNPETGELETRAHRSGMPGKAPFAQIQEGLIDSSLGTMQSHLDDLVKPTANGKSLYQNRLDKQIGALRDAGIMAGGEDDPDTVEDESLGLYANQGMQAMNYLFGDDKDSQKGKLADYNEMQKYIRGKSNFLSNLALKDELDNTSKLRTAMEDFDPIERARQRAVDRTRLARFGGGTSSIRDTSQGLFENDIKPKVDFKDLSSISGLGDTYSNAELEAAGISGGLAAQPTMSADMKENNQYANSINDLAATRFVGGRGNERQRRTRGRI